MSVETEGGKAVQRPLRGRTAPLLAAVKRLPWWVQVLAIYLAARLVSACIFAAATLQQGPGPWGAAHPGYWDFINIWDARWYGRIFNEGYPAVLPVDAAGNVQENAWAFYPLFPLLGRALSAVTGLPAAASLTTIAMLSGLGAAVVVYLLFREKATHGDALWGVVLFSTFPVAAIFQVPYAESLNTLLLAAALLLVVRRMYLEATPVVVLMCLSRPVGVAFAVMIGILLLIRLYGWWTEGRPQGGAGQLVRIAVLALISGISAVLWPILAWQATGDFQAYTKTESVWRGGGLVPFKPWFDMGAGLLGPVAGMLAPFALVAVFAWLMFCPPVVRLGVELRLWCAAYMAYLLVFLHPQTSTFRLLIPLFPLALGAVFVSRSRAYRGLLVVMFVLLQIVWVVWLWVWAQLPGGGDYPP